MNKASKEVRKEANQMAELQQKQFRGMPGKSVNPAIYVLAVLLVVVLISIIYIVISRYYKLF